MNEAEFCEKYSKFITRAWNHDWRKVYALRVVCEMKKVKFIINIMAWRLKNNNSKKMKDIKLNTKVSFTTI